MNSLRALLLAAAYVLAAQLVAGEPPQFKEASFRCPVLPINLEPTSYHVHLNISSLEPEVYEGSVEISLKLSNVTEVLNYRGEPIPCVRGFDPDTIVLHAGNSLEIKNITVTSLSTSSSASEEKQKGSLIKKFLMDREKEMIEIKKQKESLIEKFLMDREKEMIEIKVPHEKRETVHPKQLYITFKGRIGESSKSGMGLYLGAGSEDWKYIMSHFKPPYARTVFPCFDEKRFNATFSLSVTHPTNLDPRMAQNWKGGGRAWEGDLYITRLGPEPDMKEFDLLIDESSW